MVRYESEDIIPYSNSEEEENVRREVQASLMGWTRNPTDQGEELLDIESAHMISVLVDPLLFPLCYGKTLVLQNGGRVALDNVLASYSAAQVAPRHTRRQIYEDWDLYLERRSPGAGGIKVFHARSDSSLAAATGTAQTLKSHHTSTVYIQTMHICTRLLHGCSHAALSLGMIALFADMAAYMMGTI
jgi:hypothetical protein